MLRRSVSKAILCPSYCHVPYQVRSTARILSVLSFRPPSRKLSSTFSLLKEDDASATSSTTTVPPTLNNSASPTSPKSGFGGGWGKTTFTTGPALTSDEIKQRERVLAQRAPPSPQSIRRPFKSYTDRRAQQAERFTQTAPVSNYGSLGLGNERGTAALKPETRQHESIVGSNSPDSSRPLPASDAAAKHGVSSLSRGWLSFKPGKNITAEELEQREKSFAQKSSRGSPSNSVAERESDFKSGWGSFKSGQTVTGELSQKQRTLGQNYPATLQSALTSSSIAEREAQFRANGASKWRLTGFRKLDPEPVTSLAAEDTNLQSSQHRAHPSPVSSNDIESSPNDHGREHPAGKFRIVRVATDGPNAAQRTWTRFPEEQVSMQPKFGTKETIQAEAAEEVSLTSQKKRKKDRKISVSQSEDMEQEFSGSTRRRVYDVDEELDIEDDHMDRARRRRKARKKERESEKRRLREVDNSPTPIYLPEFISVANLANALSVRPSIFLESLHELGFDEATFDHVLDAETAGLIAAEYNYEPILETTEDDLVAQPLPEDTSKLPLRPPVVTIMGHVDHGKTTTLDWLRNSSVAASEHGGITQHIGAFSVTMPSGKQITFLDTPGHAAFLEMRKRGADVTDIVILVVAADDSVKPQTIEAIKHAKQANVPMIVAINKIDKDNVHVERVKQDLARHNVSVEDFGGDVQAVCVSGKTGQGMLELEEAAVTLAEMLDLRADREGNVEGWVIEATKKPGGRAATVLVRRGTLRPGDVIVAGTAWARVRNLRNEAGTEVSEALPGIPVEVDGWREQPLAGSEVLQAPTEQMAKDVVSLRLEKKATKQLTDDTEAINEARREKRQRSIAAKHVNQDSEVAYGTTDGSRSGPKGIPFIVKGDVSGSVEAIVNSISAVGNNEVYAKVLRSGVGQVSEFDIKHASAANGHIITFNQNVDPDYSRYAASQGVKILNHRIIYELIDEVKAELSEHLPPNVTQRVSGEAEVAQIFEITVKGRIKTLIAGCKVSNGVIYRSQKVRVLRGKNKDIIYDGTLASLKNIKKDVTEMRKGTECGIAFESWTGFEVGDQVQTYEEIYEKRYV
ncbi:translation initiation factor IF-2 [Emydomyces testavorans]|uniref:Translation initiation factor IF-2, mitochondrial n=1 Tax=Emydomyces testavorans TaxID=2070801 RepID=A0AAF0DBU7_9EURO|nr:translation initiation factor IF-2 [Emydomyces testavorans]